MKFSILTPVYNVAEYLPTSLDAVMSQTYKDFELILVDDGSTDESGRICDNYAERYPEHIRVIHKENQGPLAARVLAVSEATGDFCVFMDSDDGVESHWLQTVADYLEKDNEIDILLYSYRYLRGGVPAERMEPVAEDGRTWTGEQKKEVYRLLWTTNKITSLWTKAIRTSILQSDPTDYVVYYGKNMAEDLLQGLYSMTMANKIAYADHAFYLYRINDVGVSRSFRPETIPSKQTVHVYDKIMEYLPVWGMDDADTRQEVTGKWLNDTMYTLCRYYEGAADRADRRAVLAFDWNTFLPDAAKAVGSTCGNPIYRRLYTWWTKRQYGKIKRFFFSRKIKKWKKRIKGQ